MLKNKEFVRQLVVTALFLAVTLLVAIQKDECRLYCVIVVIFCIYNILVTILRYRRISKITDYLYKISSTNSDSIGECMHLMKELSEHKEFAFGSYEEGELSILQSEIYKITRRMVELNEKILKDKNYLADSLANISHQLKTPLTSMIVMADLLSNENLPAEKRQEFTKNIISQLGRIEWLLSTLLKMSRFDAGTVKLVRTNVDMKVIVEKSVSHLMIPMELKNQTLNIIKKTDDAYANADMNWTVEALSNIVKNCMEHTPEGGSITIEYGQNAIYSFVSVKDTGDGIDSDDLPHIFERFYKGKNSGKDSVGIGLAMAKMIISLEEGKIEVSSKRGEGTEFLIKLYNYNV